jgi:serine/threonine-protein kinase HipA
MATFTVVVGNADAHGKNLAFLHDTPESITLAPLYDTVPTILWPRLSRELSMSINGKFGIDEVTRADLSAEADSWALPRRAAEAVADRTLEALHSAAVGGLIDVEPLAEIVAARAENLLAGRAAGS